MQFKQTAPVMQIKALASSGEFEGYASTFGGEPDAYGDVIAAGAYTDSLAMHQAKGTMPKMFWQHDGSQPIGKWLEAAEDTTGLLMLGKLNMGVQRAKEAYALLKERDIDGLSIGYQIKEYSVDTETNIWTLEKLDLMEVSVVSIGANENATITSIKASKAQMHQIDQLKAKAAAGDLLTPREFEALTKGTWGLTNSQAERAARLYLKGQGEPAAAEDNVRALLSALRT